MSTPPNTKQDGPSITNDLPPHLYWICISIAVATLLPAVYVACLMIKSGILTPIVRYLRNAIPIFQNPDTQDEKGTETEIRTVNRGMRDERQSEDEAFGPEAKDNLWEIVDREGRDEGIRTTLLTRTRRA